MNVRPISLKKFKQFLQKICVQILTNQNNNTFFNQLVRRYQKKNATTETVIKICYMNLQQN